MSNIIGSVSLSNNNGLYLGEVNIANLNASGNEILYTTNGTTITGNTNLTYDGSSLHIGNLSILGSSDVSIGNNTFAGSGASVTVGSNSGKSGMNFYNTLLGAFCGNSISIGNGNLIAGANTAQNLSSGTNNVLLGVSAGSGQTTQNNNTVCGYYSNCTDTSGTTRTNCSVLGANIRNILSGDNEIQLGDSTTTVYYYAVGTRSDARDKTNIKTCPLGLDFINSLKPVCYNYNYREDYIQETINPETQEITTTILTNDGSKAKINKDSFGFLAQDVQTSISSICPNFAGLHQNDPNKLALDYNMFIAPLVKSIQDLSAKVVALELKLGITV